MSIRSAIAIGFATGFVTLAALTAANAQTTIRASSWHPPKHPGVTGGYEPFMKYVKEHSDGTLDFKFWSGGSLLGAKDTLAGVENDIADMGVLALTYFPAEFPHAQLISDLAMLSDNSPAVAAAVTELVVLDCPPCLKDFTDKGLVFTSSYATTPYTLISKEPITSPDDLKGKKFRSAGTVWDRWIDYVGGTAVNVSAAEMFEALDRGGVDVAIFSPAALKAFSLWDVAKYDVMMPLGTYEAMSLFTINQGFWQGLTDKQRKVILDGSTIGAMGVTFGYIDEDKAAADAADEHGVKMVDPDPSLMKQRDAFVQEDIKKLETLAKDRYGVDDAPELIAKYRELLKKWEKIVADAKGDRQTLVKAMQTEIFAKVDPSKYGM